MKKLDLALLIGLVAAIMLGNFSAFAQDCEDLRTSVMRLHILANSDSEADQQLKLMVRDRILTQSSDIFTSDGTLEMAEKAVAQNLDEIEAIALEVIMEQGYDYTVDAQITNMYFTTRVYDDITMPAGYYDALRIVIGEGKGKNWWCVLFPPLCLPAAMDHDEEFTEDQLKVLESGSRYKVKFKLVEVFEDVRNFLAQKLQSRRQAKRQVSW